MNPRTLRSDRSSRLRLFLGFAIDCLCQESFCVAALAVTSLELGDGQQCLLLPQTLSWWELSFRDPKSQIDFLGRGEIQLLLSSAHNQSLGPTLGPLNPSREEKQTPSPGGSCGAWFGMWSSRCLLNPSWKSLLSRPDRSKL